MTRSQVLGHVGHSSAWTPIFPLLMHDRVHFSDNADETQKSISVFRQPFILFSVGCNFGSVLLLSDFSSSLVLFFVFGLQRLCKANSALWWVSAMSFYCYFNLRQIIKPSKLPNQSAEHSNTPSFYTIPVFFNFRHFVRCRVVKLDFVFDTWSS